MKNINIRQRTFYSSQDLKRSDYRNVCIFQYSLLEDEEEPIKITKGRNGKEKLTIPAKKILNDERSRTYFDLLVKGNFDVNDYFLSMGYTDKFLPETEEAADQVVKKFIKDLKREAKKRGMEKIKYIYVTERGKKNGRIHHHMLLDRCLPRDLVEDLWSKQVRPFHPERERLGWCNVKRIQIVAPTLKGNGPDYMQRVSRYLTKEPKTDMGKKRWKQSTGLTLPGTSKRDNVCTMKQFQMMSLFKGTTYSVSMPEMARFIKKYHRDFVATEIKVQTNQLTGQDYIRMQLMRKSVWRRSMSILDDEEMKRLETTDRYLLPQVPDYKISGIQGVLW